MKYLNLLPGGDRVNTKRIAKGIMVTLVAITGLILLVGLIVFGFDKEDEIDVERISVLGVGPEAFDIDLGDVENRYGPGGDYTGEIFDGWDDPKQVAMAKELLEIYETSAKKEKTMLEAGMSEIDIIYFTIGTHLTESDTYNGLKGAPAKTYIPKTMVEWSKYGSTKTVEGKMMNFTNYNYKDFEKDLIEDRKELGLSTTKPYTSPGNVDSRGYYAGFRTGRRSYTGAIGATQLQPTSFKSSEHIQGNRTRGNPDWVKDPEAYAKAPNSGRAKTYRGETADIFNTVDQIFTTCNWMGGTLNTNNNLSKTLKGVGIKENSATMPFHFSLAYLFGDGGYNSRLSKDSKFMNDLFKGMANDEKFKNDLFNFYKKSYGHGADNQIMFDYLKSNPIGTWSVPSNPNNSTVSVRTPNGSTISAPGYAWVHATRVYFKGYSWYQFLQGIAYGNQANPNAPDASGGTSGVNTLWYNHMTKDSPRYSTNNSRHQETMDARMAVGYKGPYPIFNQNAPYNKQYYMSSGSNFHSGCTLYAVASAGFGYGELPEYQNGWDKNGDGTVDVMEFLGHAHTMKGNKSYITLKNDDRPTGTASVRGVMENAGYKVIPITEKASGYYNTWLDNIKAGNPTQVRSDPSPRIKAIVPKQAVGDLDYSTFDMNNLANFDVDNTTTVSMASSVHSFIAVGYKQINGEDYISIVDSVPTRRTASGSTINPNTIWLNAKEAFNNKHYGMGWGVVGTRTGETPVPPKGTGQVTNRPQGESGASNTSEKGTLPQNAIKDFIDVNLLDKDFQTMEMTSDKTQSVKISGGYQTMPRPIKPYESNASGVWIVTGMSGRDPLVIEISGLGMENPRRNSADANRAETQVFDIKQGQTYQVRVGYVRADGQLIYDSFYDE